MMGATTVRPYSWVRRWLWGIGVTATLGLLALMVAAGAALAWLVPQLLAVFGALMAAVGSFMAVPYEMATEEIVANSVVVEWVGEPVELTPTEETRWIEGGQLNGQPVGDWEFVVEARGPRGEARVLALCHWDGAAWEVKDLTLLTEGGEMGLVPGVE